MDELNTLRKRPRDSLFFLPCKDIASHHCINTAEVTLEPSQAVATISSLIASKSCEKRISAVPKSLAVCYFVIAAQTNTPPNLALTAYSQERTRDCSDPPSVHYPPRTLPHAQWSGQAD